MSLVGGPIKSFKDLETWKQGHSLVLIIYKATKQFPQDEKFGLVSQLRRSAVSITSNVAEGFSRNTYKDKLNFYAIALGSLNEAHSQLLIAKDLEYLTESEYLSIENQIVTVSKLLHGLIKKTKLMISEL